MIPWDWFCHEDFRQTVDMYVYKVVLGVDLINELLRKSERGGGGKGLFKKGNLNLLMG